MKLIFRRDENNEIKVLIRNQLAEDSFSYTAMIKSLISKNKFEESEFDQSITEQEKDSIHKMLVKINQVMITEQSLDSINIEINGFYVGHDNSGIPDYSGIYFVYESTYNKSENTVALHRIIYIGDSENVKEDIKNNKLYPQWLKFLSEGNELCFASGKVEGQNRTRIKAAYIYNHKPLQETMYNNNFPFDNINIISTGANGLISENFTVNKT